MRRPSAAFVWRRPLKSVKNVVFPAVPQTCRHTGGCQGEKIKRADSARSSLFNFYPRVYTWPSETKYNFKFRSCWPINNQLLCKVSPNHRAGIYGSNLSFPRSFTSMVILFWHCKRSSRDLIQGRWGGGGCRCRMVVRFILQKIKWGGSVDNFLESWYL